MFSLFFAATPVRDYATALFKKFFHTRLDRGVYLAPSPYEAAFLSTAHVGADLDRAIMADTIKTL